MGDGPSKTQDTSSKTDPWAPQQPYLLSAFEDAQKAYDTNTAQGAYSGDYVAAPSQQQYDAYGNAVTQGYNAQNSNNGLLSQSAANTTSGSTAANSAATSLGNFANTDQTQNNIAAAKQYVSGLDIPGQVQAGMLAANQNAAESSVPNIYRTAAQSGGVNSDRAALSQGVVERGLAQQAAGLSASLNNSAYATGLSNAQQSNSQQLQALAQQGSVGTTLNGQGTTGTNSAVANQTALDQQITAGANGATGLDQATLNNLMAKYNGGQNFTTQQLQNLMSIIGKSYGSQSTGTSTTQDNPSMMQNIGSGLGILGALF